MPIRKEKTDIEVGVPIVEPVKRSREFKSGPKGKSVPTSIADASTHEHRYVAGVDPAELRSEPLTASTMSDMAPRKETNSNSVTIEKSFTKNRGDFNSVKITVGITLNVNPTEKDISEAKGTMTIANQIIDAEMECQLIDIEETGTTTTAKKR